MKTFLPKDPGDNRKWFLIDADGQPLGRLAVKVASLIRGKGKVYFTPAVDVGDFVVVVNAAKVHLSGRKAEQKIYKNYSGWRDGLKETSASRMLERHPDRMVLQAVKRMLPRNTLSRKVFARLKVYAGAEHPHAAQKPEKVG